MSTLTQAGYESVSRRNIPDILWTKLWPNSQNVCQCAATASCTPPPKKKTHTASARHARCTAAAAAGGPRGQAVPPVPSRERAEITQRDVSRAERCTQGREQSGGKKKGGGGIKALPPSLAEITLIKGSKEQKNKRFMPQKTFQSALSAFHARSITISGSRKFSEQEFPRYSSWCHFRLVAEMFCTP